MCVLHASGLTTTMLLAAGVTVAACTGCGSGGPPTYPVSGSVVYAGRAVPTGLVTLVPMAGGERWSGAIGGDGSFSLQAAAGDFKVAVLAPRESNAGAIDSTNWERAFKGAAVPYVPGLYGDPETTPLKFTVVADGENLCNLTIEPLKPRRP